MAGQLDNATMTPLLLQNRNAVIVGDAEERSRQEMMSVTQILLLSLTRMDLLRSLGEIIPF
jgi:hypothetical protein